MLPISDIPKLYHSSMKSYNSIDYSTHQAKSIWASLTLVATFSCSFTAFHLVAWFPVAILLISLAFSFSCLALLDADTLAYFRSFNFFTDV